MKTFLTCALLALGLTNTLSGCKEDPVEPKPPVEEPTPPTPTPGTPIETPYSTLPNEFVGTWFAKDNKKPLTTYWDEGTVLGELGFRDFRTMVFTKDGKNAVEYHTFSVDLNGKTRMRFYKITGTVEYKPSSTPRTLTFYAQRGVMRVYDQGKPSEEVPIAESDMRTYRTAWQSPEATSFATGTNYLTCKRLDGSIPVSAEYEKVNPNAPAPPSVPSPTPPITGSYVKIGDLYYATATIGGQEWTTMNYAGPGGIKDSDKPHYGTFVKAADLGSIPVPTGWRIPTRADYEKLLASQGVTLQYNWSADNLQTTQALGQLMATTGWRREDGYSTNKNGFNGIPANIRVTDPTANPHGEGSNCIYWTADRDPSTNWPITFKIVQMTNTTLAAIVSYAPGSSTGTMPHIPVRFVRDK
ncbi:FISUMP domain-containing protein [Hymenobacter crusticola]|uniref:Fibrobacter succinogenes major paralogous domain-containing protein n=1 Tax=Hymenobacter crusticola TaxID=1770526 RepID=A0A243WI41_9BACT|nr:FISUMP domain-containing protein [Hymenobacter crusticola]OUJ74679.1 hypothetical protein BXP70_07900 [Hymenobacter crusticola]